MQDSRRINRNQRYLDAVKRSTPDQCQKLISYATPDQVDTLCEIIHNTLRGNVTLSPGQVRHLRPYQKALRHAGNPRLPLSTR